MLRLFSYNFVVVAMKKLLKNEYNVYDIELVENSEYTYFLFHEKLYYLVPYVRSEEELKELVFLNEELLSKGIPTGKFVLNNHNSYVTIYNGKKYALLEMPINSNQEYNVLDMVQFADQLVIGSKKSILYRNQWAELWSAKADYFEYQIRQLGKDKPIILNSFSYYLGLMENAIAYVNNTTKKYKLSVNEHITLQRKRVVFPNIVLNYFNPIHYVIDIEVRDIASYFKSLFFNSYEDLFTEVNAYLKRRKLGMFGYQLLYARLMYPSFYFDIYEKVMEGEMEESALLPIIKKAEDYEFFLQDMYQIISKFAPIEKVEWIVNKKEL